MKPRFSHQTNHALTLVEVLVVVFIVATLLAILLPALSGPRRQSSKINCINGLKQIGLACRVWSDDNNDKYPMEISVTNGGTMELSATGNVAATFQILSNELSTPKILICPADKDRTASANFTTDFNNSKISYFVGLDASTNYPQALLSGDDNFAMSGVAVKAGLFAVSTNTALAWTETRHVKAGNIGLADGSVLQVTTIGLQTALQHTGLATNRLVIP